MSMYSNISEEHKNYLISLKKQKILIKLTQIFILVVFFAVWELAARMKWIDAFIFSQPSRIINSMYNMILDGSLFYHIGITLGETIIGFLASTILGTIIAIVLWWNSYISEVLEPYLVILNSLPKTALAPILIVWIGNNMKSIVVTAIMTSIVVTILTVWSGFLEVDKDKIKLIKTFGGTKLQTLTKVVLPSSVPTIINALKVNIGLSYVGVIVGEFLVANAGLGYLIVYGSQIFKLDWVMMSVLILAILAAILYKLIVILEHKFLKWRE